MAQEIEVTLEVPGDRFVVGDPVVLLLRARNLTGAPVSLVWPTAQRYDFVIERDGRRVWVWSDGRAFAQMLVDQTLDPRGEAVFREVWRTADLGRYRAQGIVTTVPPRMSRWVDFEVLAEPME